MLRVPRRGAAATAAGEESDADTPGASGEAEAEEAATPGAGADVLEENEVEAQAVAKDCWARKSSRTRDFQRRVLERCRAVPARR